MTDTPVERPEIITALRIAHDEIVALRRRIADLEPRAHAYDTIAQIAHISRKPVTQGYGEDPAWRVKQIVDRLVAERQAEREQP